MSNNQSKLQRTGFVCNKRKLSLSTRIEILKKQHLIRKAKRLLRLGMQTPSPASIQDDCEKEVGIEILAEILETSRNYERHTSLLEYHPHQNNSKPSSSDSDENYDSDNFETESINEDSEETEKLCFVDERPEIIEL